MHPELTALSYIDEIVDVCRGAGYVFIQFQNIKISAWPHISAEDPMHDEHRLHQLLRGLGIRVHSWISRETNYDHTIMNWNDVKFPYHRVNLIQRRHPEIDPIGPPEQS